MAKGTRSVAGVKIGDSTIVAVVGRIDAKGMVERASLGVTETRGFKRNKVTGIGELSESIRRAADEAGVLFGEKIDSARIALHGKHDKSFEGKGGYNIVVPALKDISKAIAGAGIDIVGVIPMELAAAGAVLNKKEEEAGALVINIGSRNISCCLFDGGDIPRGTSVSLGGEIITRDIAALFKIPFHAAERVKREAGLALPSMIEEGECVELKEMRISRKTLAEAIEARAEDMLFFVWRRVNKYLGKTSPSCLVFLTGGGATLPGLAELAQGVFERTTRIGRPTPERFKSEAILNLGLPSFAAVAGLIIV